MGFTASKLGKWRVTKIGGIALSLALGSCIIILLACTQDKNAIYSAETTLSEMLSRKWKGDPISELHVLFVIGCVHSRDLAVNTPIFALLLGSLQKRKSRIANVNFRNILGFITEKRNYFLPC